VAPAATASTIAEPPGASPRRQHRRCRRCLREAPDDLERSGAGFHVDEDDVGTVLVDECDRLVSGRRLATDGEPVLLQDEPQAVSYEGVTGDE
jgi:hypothetical protein